MTKQCPRCKSQMFPLPQVYPASSQTDQDKEIVEWYCSDCKTTFGMTEEEKIKAYSLLNERED